MDDPQRAASLLEDYKLKMTFAVEQTNRMQTQFQVMLTLESLLATTLVVSNTGSLNAGAKWIALLEVGLSAAWLLVGRVGRTRAVTHRADYFEAGKRWAQAAGLGSGYKPAGDGPGVVVVGVLAPLLLTIGWSLLFLIFLFVS
jgi:hypothetical protein